MPNKENLRASEQYLQIQWYLPCMFFSTIVDGAKNSQEDMAADEDQSSNGKPVSHDGGTLIYKNYFCFVHNDENFYN